MKIKIGRFQWNSRIEHRRMAVLLGVAFIALVAGVSILVGIVRLPTISPRSSTTAPGTLSIARSGDKDRNQIFDEEARLLDPAPLFLPTQYNYTQTDLTNITLREPTQTFPAFRPSYTYADGTFSIPFPDPVRVPAQPVEALDYGHTQTPYATLGRTEQPAAPLAARLAYVEVVQMKTGQILAAFPIARPEPQPADLPETLATGDLWAPIEFLAPINVAGLAAPLALMKSTNAPVALVEYLSQYLDKTLHIDARPELTPGLYIFRVGP